VSDEELLYVLKNFLPSLTKLIINKSFAEANGPVTLTVALEQRAFGRIHSNASSFMRCVRACVRGGAWDR
jgi:hypothetical protein